ncbi:MAG: hypothetical protein GWP07_01710 [Xanthomonadaceae bacterium]|nr:hypothetical protein [Xanthomonadaceae bacterium]
MTAGYGQTFSRMMMGVLHRSWMIIHIAVFILCCLLPLRLDAAVQTEDLIFTAGPQQMIFTIHTRQPVPEIQTHFIESADHVILSLPDIEPDFPALVYQSFDDEWVSGYGLKLRDDKFYWQFEKRQESIPLKKYLAVQTTGRRIIISIMKPYHEVSQNLTPKITADQSVAEAENLATSSAKMARINALLEGEDSLNKTEKIAAPESAGLLYPGMRMFASLAALIALILISYRPVKKMLQKTGNAPDGGLVKILQTIPIGMKRQIMFLDVADEVLVIGLSGDQMTMLTRITEPEKLESLRLLQCPEGGKKSFISSLRSFSGSKLMSRETASESQPGEGNAGLVHQDPYGEVVAQIKQRLQGLNRLQ